MHPVQSIRVCGRIPPESATATYCRRCYQMHGVIKLGLHEKLLTSQADRPSPNQTLTRWWPVVALICNGPRAVNSAYIQTTSSSIYKPRYDLAIMAAMNGEVSDTAPEGYSTVSDVAGKSSSVEETRHVNDSVHAVSDQ